MEHQPKKNTKDELQDTNYGQDNRVERKQTPTTDNSSVDANETEDTDKYLAMEQPGVSYTHDTNPTENSDFAEYDSDNDDAWSEEGGNSKNSDAFNQDDYILDDNIDLDEDQNQSISSDDEDFEESNERYTN